MRAGAGDGAGAGAAPHGRGARPGPASAPGAQPGSCPRPPRSAQAPLARPGPAPRLRSPSPHPAESTARPPEKIHQSHEGLRGQSGRGRASSSCPLPAPCPPRSCCPAAPSPRTSSCSPSADTGPVEAACHPYGLTQPCPSRWAVQNKMGLSRKELLESPESPQQRLLTSVTCGLSSRPVTRHSSAALPCPPPTAILPSYTPPSVESSDCLSVSHCS